MVKLLLIASFTLTALIGSAQSVFFKTGNINSTLPVTGFPSLFYANYHPYVEGGYEFLLKEWDKSSLFQSVGVGYFYHRFMQHGIPLTTEARWVYTAPETFHPYVALGGGYLHAIPISKQLVLNDEGEYERAGGVGRSQATFSLSLGTDIQVSSWTFLAEYKMLFQTPFVKSYVPLLPYGIVQVGVRFQLPQSE